MLSRRFISFDNGFKVNSQTEEKFIEFNTLF